ncbi:hypothetical protein ACHAXR_010523 [Thalassiosira sp. AJA248-18]
MARGNNRRMRVNDPNVKGREETVTNAQISQSLVCEMIESAWKSMPLGTRPFLLKALGRLHLGELVNFWSNPVRDQYTRGGMACITSGTSWFLAMQYLKLGMLPEARALTLNGSFIQQCFVSGCHAHLAKFNSKCIEEVILICYDTSVSDYELPVFSQGFFAVESPQTMKAYLLKVLPIESQSMMSASIQMKSRYNKIEYANQISDGWKTSPSNNQRAPSKTPDDARIQLVLAEDKDEGQRDIFDIGSSTTLKTLFNDYAEKRGVSLRALRFSFRGNTLFLSSVGNMTPTELEMQDQDVINVHDTNSAYQEYSNVSLTLVDTHTKQTSKTPKAKIRTQKAKEKCKQVHLKKNESVQTLEEFKVQHSKILTKLHEEVQPRLKEIRNRLNALKLERQPRKQKKRCQTKTKSKGNVDNYILPNSGTSGGKAGKPHFIVQVGEVENLYKTTKPCDMQHSAAAVTMIDLHGCTKNEALNILNEKLPGWVETAMRGEYPWVLPVKIVCGCGNQILSETVQEWIKSTGNVSNAPKNSIV